MVFSSLIFLFVYLPVTLLIYYVVPRKFKNAALLLFSLIFYGWGEPKWVLIMIFSTVLDYTCSNVIERHRENKRACKAALIVSIVLNLGVLFFFKYTDFVLDSIPFLSSVPRLNISLPIGISFYTFQTMSCTIDVYRNEAEASKSIIDFGTYVTMFPQLIAGPIVRFKDVCEQLKNRRESITKFAGGVCIFCVGLAKKVLLANQFGELWDFICERISSGGTGISGLSGASGPVPALSALLGLLCYTLQIYFDFSGYSDMAIGLGRMFGFELPVNFDYPYCSKSITEFWRRWHITLGIWFREYVYIPLGGNRGGTLKMLRNIFIVWFLTGLWHGASWNFVLWGIYYGVVLLCEKLFLLKALKKAPAFVQHIYSVVLIMFGWALFSFTDFSELGAFLSALFGGNGLLESWTVYEFLTCIPLLAAGIIGATKLPVFLWKKFEGRFCAVAAWGRPVLCLLSLAACTACLVNASYNPFLYFRF